LAAEFRFRGQTLFVIVDHFNSKGGDTPLFGRLQPTERPSEVQRHKQAQVVNDFVDQILGAFKNARIVVLGDLNDFEFSETLQILEGGGALANLMDRLPKAERYSYVFEGNSQVLDQMLVSDKLDKQNTTYDPPLGGRRLARRPPGTTPPPARRRSARELRSGHGGRAPRDVARDRHPTARGRRRDGPARGRGTARDPRRRDGGRGHDADAGTRRGARARVLPHRGAAPGGGASERRSRRERHRGRRARRGPREGAALVLHVVVVRHLRQGRARGRRRRCGARRQRAHGRLRRRGLA